MRHKAINAFKIGCLTFIISLIISYLFGFSLAVWVSLIILFLVISAGILFDIIGTAVTAAREAPFHAMGTDRVRGSKEAIYLIRRAGQVANFCNDVVGDVAGTVSGAITASTILQFAKGDLLKHQDLLSAGAIALLAACTVGGKAFGKSFAIQHANEIIFSVGKVLSLFKLIKVDLKKKTRRKPTRKGTKR